jgi:hypothetical protein
MVQKNRNQSQILKSQNLVYRNQTQILKSQNLSNKSVIYPFENLKSWCAVVQARSSTIAQLEEQVESLQRQRTGSVDMTLLVRVSCLSSASNTLCPITLQCIICVTAAIDVVFVPCYHLVLW